MHRPIALAAATLAGLAFARQDAIRFVRLSSVQPLAGALAATGEKMPDLTGPRQWDGWIRQHDAEMRGRVDHNTEDSISMLILFGTSFTTLPKLGSPSEAGTPAGDLTPAASARVDAFLDALDRLDGERFRFVLQFLRRWQITQEELRAYLCGNLRRVALERPRGDFNSTPISATVLEAALRSLRDQGKAPPKIRHIAVIGPGLNPRYDPDADDLFPALEAALHSGLAKASSVDLTILDINPLVLSHLRAIAVRTGARYAARVSVQDLNIVTQSLEPGSFDLLVATSALAGYSRLDQSLALVNIAQMAASGGVLLLNSAPLPIIPRELELLNSGAPKEIAAYRRR